MRSPPSEDIRLSCSAATRQAVFRRSRSQGNDGAPRRCRPGQGLLRNDSMGALRAGDAQTIVRLPQAGHRRGSMGWRRRPAASLSPAVISRSALEPAPPSARPASISACSARRRWWRCRGQRHRATQAMGNAADRRDHRRDRQRAKDFGLVNRVVPQRIPAPESSNKYAQPSLLRNRL